MLAQSFFTVQPPGCVRVRCYSIPRQCSGWFFLFNNLSFTFYRPSALSAPRWSNVQMPRDAVIFVENDKLFRRWTYNTGKIGLSRYPGTDERRRTEQGRTAKSPEGLRSRGPMMSKRGRYFFFLFKYFSRSARASMHAFRLWHVRNVNGNGIRGVKDVYRDKWTEIACVSERTVRKVVSDAGNAGWWVVGGCCDKHRRGTNACFGEKRKTHIPVEVG